MLHFNVQLLQIAKQWVSLSLSLSISFSLLTLEASLAFCLLNYCQIDMSPPPPPCNHAPSPVCFLWEWWFSVCFLCFAEESSLIMKHKETQRDLQRLTNLQSSSVAQPMPGKQKSFIISVIYFTSVGGLQTSPPTRFQTELQGEAFLVWHVWQCKCSFWSTLQKHFNND